MLDIKVIIIDVKLIIPNYTYETIIVYPSLRVISMEGDLLIIYLRINLFDF